jgi:glycosyltransferase involved in cell wall biosynthesis
MKIIIDCLPFSHNFIHPSTVQFILKCHQFLQQKNPEMDCEFIVDKKFDGNQALKNMPLSNIIFKKMLPNKIGWKIWYGYQLPSIAKKNQADLLITTGGITSSSHVSQCVWMAGLRTKFPSKKSKSHYDLFKKRQRKTLLQSKMILSISEKTKLQIVHQYKFDEKKVKVIKPFPDEAARPLSWAEKESIKTKYAAGKEYYIIIVNDRNNGLIDLLKAFSQFKKRLHSNMQLVLAGEGLKNDISFVQKLENFKYRSDVHLYSNPAEGELIKLIAASYALVHPFSEDEVGSNIVNAFEAGIPVIIPEGSSLIEIAGDAVLYADLKNAESLANQLILLYKDEKLRFQLIENGKITARLFNMEASITELYNAILLAAACDKNKSV